MNPAVPKTYQPLYKVKELPKMVAKCLELWGTKEVPGAKSNPEILGWAKVVGVSKEYTNDGIAWCGLTVAYICHETDKPIVMGPLWALNWRFWGIEVKKGDEARGDIYVTERRDSDGKLVGGHVGIIIGEDQTHFHVFGGNKSDTAMVARFPKTRKYWARRPVYVNRPKGAIKYMVDASGAPEVTRVA